METGNKALAFDPSEDQYLRRSYKKLTTAEMATELGRTPASVANRLHHLRLRRLALRKNESTMRPVQKRVTIFFDVDLMPAITAGARKAGLSMTAFVQELVRAGLRRKV